MIDSNESITQLQSRLLFTNIIQTYTHLIVCSMRAIN